MANAYDTRTETLDDHIGTVVETVVIDGVTVDIVNHKKVKTAAGVISIGRDAYEALTAGTYVLRAPEISRYVNSGEHHDAGDWAGACGGYAAPAPGHERADSLGTSTTPTGARAAARRALKTRAQYAQYGAYAVANIHTVTDAEWAALNPTLIPEVGDLVAIHSHGRTRVGVAIKIGTKRVRALVATPSGGYAQGAEAPTDTVRVWRRCTSLNCYSTYVSLEDEGPEAAARIASHDAWRATREPGDGPECKRNH